MKKYFFVLLTFVAITVVIFFVVRIEKEKKITKQENEKIFQTVLFDPLAHGITNIRGFAHQTGKSDTYLRFNITGENIGSLLTLHEYKKVDCANEAVFSKLFAPKKIKHLVEGSVSFWDISEHTEGVCYATFLFTPSGIEGKLYQNSIRQKAQSEILIDQKNNVVFFHESGILVQ